MRRYWIDQNQIENNEVHFSGEQFHHIFDVCRQTVGHHFEVITNESKAYLVEVSAVAKKTATAIIKEERFIQPLAKPHIHIALSVSRYPVMDSVIERATEMGVTSILPFVSDYSYIRKEKELPEGKFDRWNKIVISATQQCGRGELLKIQPLTNFKNVIPTINPNDKNWCLFAYEGSAIRSISEEIGALRNKHLNSASPLPENVWVIIGSEGGFSTQEAAEMQKLGLHPVTLGQQILRVETACLTLVSVLKYDFGLMK